MTAIKLLPNGDTITIEVVFAKHDRTPAEVAEALRLHARALEAVAREHHQSANKLAPQKVANVYWDGYGYEWQEYGNSQVGSDAPQFSLDETIRDVHAAGYAVRQVTTTRGSMPARPRAKSSNQSENK